MERRDVDQNKDFKKMVPTVHEQRVSAQQQYGKDRVACAHAVRLLAS